MTITEVGRTARIEIDGREGTIKLPVESASDGSIGLDVATLFPKNGILAVEPGFNSVGIRSRITYINPIGDGKEATLQYRGYPIAELAERSEPIETAYLLLFGELPTSTQLADFKTAISDETVAHPEIAVLARHLPSNWHPMGRLGCLVSSLASLLPVTGDTAIEQFDRTAIRILAQMPILSAWTHASKAGLSMPEPSGSRGYVENYLAMIAEDGDTVVDPLRVRIMNAILLLHADHEQNASTTTVRGIRSTAAGLYSAISGGIDALSGPLHGGANERVIAMLRQIVEDGTSPQDFVSRAESSKLKEDRLMGFGHRIYKAYDPRATIMRELCRDFFAANGTTDPLLQTALELERLALSTPYFVDHKLYPNVDFYSGILMKAMGIPTDEFTVIFALGRTAGWLAHAREMQLDPDTKIVRPRQMYLGELNREFVPIEERSE